MSTGAGLLLAGRYRLTESIGRGGMGKVWRAQDELLHRTVAVKELTAGLYVSESDRAVLHARTQKEARAAARISHPGVVTVHDVLEYDGRPWIVMQYVDGPSLADAAKESGPMPVAETARVGLHVLGALSAAHAAGVLHRDVKPGNVLLASDGRALLTDFGIAAIEGDSTITRTGEIVGSIDYLAPERVRGADPGPASDLWSLGATLYTAVEGTSPFRRTSPLSTMQAVVTEEPTPSGKAGALGPVITALLCKEPEDRPSAAELERMLLEVMEGRRPQSAQAYVPTRSVSRGDAGVATAQLPAPGGLTPTVNPSVHPSAHPSVSHSRTAPGAHGVHGAPGAPLGGPPGHPARQRPAKRPGRWRRALLSVTVVAAVAGGAAYAAVEYADRGTGTEADGPGSSTTPRSQDPTGSTGGVPSGESPDGFTRTTDPEGFSLLVPNGWVRQLDGNQIDYTPDNGRHRIRVSIDPSPDFENPYMHMLDVEKTVEKRLPEYKRLTLHSNVFRDHAESALWEFTWTETKDHPGKRRAIDQVYYADDGTEYAVYMSGPAGNWSKIRQQFDIVLRSWQPPPSDD
ncbi:serine/threonine-protein kinase [Streptomyces sp. SCSIO 30461]|uniref:serine/threonine-protein kinase n=1 Tax=Streptomyces sp. SCSIO 30461 TaxID=3118085 RepID=UPI0030D12E01